MNCLRFVNNFLALLVTALLMLLFSMLIILVLTPLSLVLHPRLYLDSVEETLDRVTKGAEVRDRYKRYLINHLWR